nr:MAG: DNA pilot protein [Microvirus sp.]
MGLFSAIGSIGGALVSGILGGKSAEKAGDQNAELQREFAQNGLRWKVADAKAAGIHPLFAVGAPPITASPAYAGAPTPDLSSVGQDIGRAIDAKRTPVERTTARIEALSVERAELENDLLRSQIAKINQPASPPPMPGGSYVIDGQGNSSVSTVPLQRNSSVSGIPSVEAGAINDLGFSTTHTGYVPVPSSDVKDRIEDTWIPEMMWNARNLLAPNFGGGQPPPKSALPKGFDTWDWSAGKQEWVPALGGRGYLQYGDVPSMIRAYRRGDTSGYNWR